MTLLSPVTNRIPITGGGGVSSSLRPESQQLQALTSIASACSATQFPFLMAANQGGLM
jgi:hypothetical protein